MLPHHLTNLDSFRVKHIPIEIRHFTGKKNENKHF